MAQQTQKTLKAPRADAAANRERILKAAGEVFALRGLDAEVREIAERAGVGIGTLYRRFGDRDGLLTALLQERKADMKQRLRAVVSAGPPAAALRATIHAVAEGCRECGSLSAAVIDDQADQPGQADCDEAEFTGLLTGLLKRGIREGAFRADLDVSMAVATMKSMFASGALLVLTDERSPTSAADAFADLLLAAVKA